MRLEYPAAVVGHYLFLVNFNITFVSLACYEVWRTDTIFEDSIRMKISPQDKCIVDHPLSTKNYCSLHPISGKYLYSRLFVYETGAILHLSSK